jgi:hypothetical protein
MNGITIFYPDKKNFVRNPKKEPSQYIEQRKRRTEEAKNLNIAKKKNNQI